MAKGNEGWMIAAAIIIAAVLFAKAPATTPSTPGNPYVWYFLT